MKAAASCSVGIRHGTKLAKKEHLLTQYDLLQRKSEVLGVKA
ncbi:hypothetical protein AB4Z50_26720 [Paenibacillus sp. 2TAB26]